MNSQPIKPYTWSEIQGKLGLPAAVSANKTRAAHAARPGANVATLPELMQRQCRDGERTDHLTRLAGALIASGLTRDECIALCRQWNEQNFEPMDDEKIKRTCESISAADRRNHPERYALMQMSEPLFELKLGRIDRYIASDPPARRWLLSDLIVLGKAAAVVAPGGSSKSQWLLQLAVGVASGVPVAGHWQVGERGGVLVFFAEDDEDEIHRRLKRVLDQLSLEGHASALAGIEDRLYAFSTIGHDTLLTKRGSTGEVTSTATLERIVTLAEQIKDLKLIIIDPASRFRGGEENSNEDATRFVEALEALAKRTGATVMIAHHTNKGSYSNDHEPGQGASRGASALTDGLRWQMHLGRLTDKQLKEVGVAKELNGRYVAATVTKTNYSAFPAPVFLERLEGGYLTASTAAQSRQRFENSVIARILHVLAHQARPISTRQLEDRHGGLSGELKMAKHEVRKMVKEAGLRGLLTGGERKPLALTESGVIMAKNAMGTAAHARSSPSLPSLEKSQ